MDSVFQIEIVIGKRCHLSRRETDFDPDFDSDPDENKRFYFPRAFLISAIVGITSLPGIVTMSVAIKKS